MMHERSDSQSPSPKKNSPKKVGSVVMGEEGYLDDLYAELDKLGNYKPKKHASPTRRLTQQMDAAVEQKTYLSKQPEFKADRSRYGLTYVVGVSNTYVVQPKNGKELPYELAEKRPLAFYREVMNGDVKEHKVAKSPTKMRQRAFSFNRPHSSPMKKTKKRSKFEY